MTSDITPNQIQARFEGGRYFAVCCTDEIEYKDINLFLHEVYEAGKSMSGRYWNADFTIVADLDTKIRSATEDIQEEGIFKSPFVVSSINDIICNIRDFKIRTDSDITTRAMVALDQDGIKGEYATIIYTGQDAKRIGIQQVKIGWNWIETFIESLMVKGGWQELVEGAEKLPDGVYR